MLKQSFVKHVLRLACVVLLVCDSDAAPKKRSKPADTDDNGNDRPGTVTGNVTEVAAQYGLRVKRVRTDGGSNSTAGSATATTSSGTPADLIPVGLTASVSTIPATPAVPPRRTTSVQAFTPAPPRTTSSTATSVAESGVVPAINVPPPPDAAVRPFPPPPPPPPPPRPPACPPRPRRTGARRRRRSAK